MHDSTPRGWTPSTAPAGGSRWSLAPGGLGAVLALGGFGVTRTPTSSSPGADPNSTTSYRGVVVTATDDNLVLDTGGGRALAIRVTATTTYDGQLEGGDPTRVRPGTSVTVMGRRRPDRIVQAWAVTVTVGAPAPARH